MNSVHKIYEYKLAMDSLGIYRGILGDNVIKKLYRLTESLCSNEADFNQILIHYNDFYYELLESGKGKGLKGYIFDYIIYSENPFAKASQSNELEKVSDELKKAASQDLQSLQFISDFSKNNVITFFEGQPYYEKVQNLPGWSNEDLPENKELQLLYTSTSWCENVDGFWSFHNRNGAGIFSRYKGFIWEGDTLQGVVSLDPVTLNQLVNYERQKEIVVKNTRAFLKGHPANNILLYGSRGTGKSSTVKALLNEFYNEGLRVIEIPKQYLITFPKLIRILKNSPQKFILFIDDLAFEDSEETYTALKAILEGGLETRPDNVIIYATSNRRHIIKEKFSDREGLSGSYADEEIHAADSLEEKLSLADRFGITVTYIHPNQKEYLSIVKTMASQRGIDIPEDELERRALQWAMSYNGRSPRTARQFIASLEGGN